MIVLISICIFFQSSIVLAFYLFIIILTKLGRIFVKRPRTIIWMGHYIRNTLLLCCRLLHDVSRGGSHPTGISWRSLKHALALEFHHFPLLSPQDSTVTLKRVI